MNRNTKGYKVFVTTIHTYDTKIIKKEVNNGNKKIDKN